MKYLLIVFVLVFIACGDKKQQGSTAPGMKCGSGKCGTNMFDGNSALAKKKKNILKQMRKDDTRKECVLSAKTTKAAYNCVREPGGNKLTMKCGTGRCGTDVPAPEIKKKESSMKCGTGKCGSSM